MKVLLHSTSDAPIPANMVVNDGTGLNVPSEKVTEAMRKLFENTDPSAGVVANSAKYLSEFPSASSSTVEEAVDATLSVMKKINGDEAKAAYTQVAAQCKLFGDDLPTCLDRLAEAADNPEINDASTSWAASLKAWQIRNPWSNISAVVWYRPC